MKQLWNGLGKYFFEILLCQQGQQIIFKKKLKIKNIWKMVMRTRSKGKKMDNSNSNKPTTPKHQNNRSPSPRSNQTHKKVTRRQIQKQKKQRNLKKARNFIKNIDLTLKKSDKKLKAKKKKQKQHIRMKQVEEQRRRREGNMMMEEQQMIHEEDEQEGYNVEVLMCPICDNFLTLANQLECGHCFCDQCLSNYLLVNKNCLICEKHIHRNEIKRSRKIDQIINEFIDYVGGFQKEDYESRIKTWNESKQASRLKNFVVGTRIDIQDHDFNWHQGIILRQHAQRIHGKPVLKAIKVQYLGSDRVQVIDIQSDRIRKFGYYTNNPNYLQQVRQPVLIGRVREQQDDKIDEGQQMFDMERIDEARRLLQEDLNRGIQEENLHMDVDVDNLEGMYAMYEHDQADQEPAQAHHEPELVVQFDSANYGRGGNEIDIIVDPVNINRNRNRNRGDFGESHSESNSPSGPNDF